MTHHLTIGFVDDVAVRLKPGDSQRPAGDRRTQGAVVDGQRGVQIKGDRVLQTARCTADDTKFR